MFALVPDIPVSEKTLADHRAAKLRGLSVRFPGMAFTYDGGWHGDRDSHGHTEDGMGALWVAICDCPECLMAEFPGWTISGNRHDGYDAAEGESEPRHFASRSALVCRLATHGWGTK